MDDRERSNHEQSTDVFPQALNVPMLTPDRWLWEKESQLTGREEIFKGSQC